MQSQEFEKRTPFLDEADHKNYADWFEPAYMAAKNIDKDDFCSMLKDKTARRFVRMVSEAFRDSEAAERDAARERFRLRDCARTLGEENDGLRKALSQISADCDRALAKADAAA